MKYKVYYKIETNEVLTIKVDVFIVYEQVEQLNFLKGYYYFLIEAENKINAVGIFGEKVARLINGAAVLETYPLEAQDVVV